MVKALAEGIHQAGESAKLHSQSQGGALDMACRVVGSFGLTKLGRGAPGVQHLSARRSALPGLRPPHPQARSRRP